MNIYQGRGVSPRTIMAAPTRYITLGMENSCDTSISPISASFETLVTRTPVASDIISDGIALTRPSPMVSMPYFWRAVEASSPSFMIPMTMPPAKLIRVMIRPAVASPLTYFVAPSMEPKKVDSSCIFSLLTLAS